MQHSSQGRDMAPSQAPGSNVDFAFPLTVQNSLSRGECKKS